MGRIATSRVGLAAFYNASLEKSIEGILEVSSGRTQSALSSTHQLKTSQVN